MESADDGGFNVLISGIGPNDLLELVQKAEADHPSTLLNGSTFQLDMTSTTKTTISAVNPSCQESFSQAVNIDRIGSHWVGTTHLGTDCVLDGSKSVVDFEAPEKLHVVYVVKLHGFFTAGPETGTVIAAEKVAEDLIKRNA
ncbi:hypothetical protein CORC01_06287 [Colletotrichum orchidophilum]|uniref:Uncharacterized protein n=1 Tax=Colletotrichum orchidophilum TaxID=1209926 RepID=A0A1G4BB05_9PEZI|nr:uncharacterized protein CORC01_06287 [Colletotrichum orchidophilum]OHE98496.1 hypothetical protein CORC01_06287 [Colletotrichum orchidophilum]